MLAAKVFMVADISAGVYLAWTCTSPALGAPHVLGQEARCASATGAVMEGRAGTERSRGPDGARIPRRATVCMYVETSPSAGSRCEQGLETDPRLPTSENGEILTKLAPGVMRGGAWEISNSILP